MLVCPTLHGLTIRHMIIAIGALDNQAYQILLITIVLLIGVLVLLLHLLGILKIAMLVTRHLYAKNLQTFNYIF